MLVGKLLNIVQLQIIDVIVNQTLVALSSKSEVLEKR